MGVSVNISGQLKKQQTNQQQNTTYNYYVS